MKSVLALLLAANVFGADQMLTVNLGESMELRLLEEEQKTNTTAAAKNQTKSEQPKGDGDEE